MSVAYRPRVPITADPAEVRDVFLRHGHRGLERMYGSSNNVVRQLIALAGGAELLAERAKVQACGRKAGGKRSVDNTVSNVGTAVETAPETAAVISDKLSSR